MKIPFKKIAMIYLIIYCLCVFLYCSIKGPLTWGEYDDYTLPVASLLNDHNFSITQEDVAFYKTLFPELSDIDVDYGLSGYKTPDGKAELTWYFPTYAILSLPMVLLLKAMNLPASYGFMYTGIMLIMSLLLMIYHCYDGSDKKRFVLILLLSINPIVFYIPWLLAEAFIFAFLGMAIFSWNQKWYRRAAVCLSIAGTLNITVMATGFIMIFDYLLVLWHNYTNKYIFGFIKENIIKLASYGCCYIIGIIPAIYNFCYTGHINLTASYSSFTTNERESVFQRFASYFLDLNYGYVPYYGLILFLAIILLITAFRKKCWNFVKIITAFVVNVFLYSIMVHINCGGAGIARYSSWCSVILVMAVFFNYDIILENTLLRKAADLVISANQIILFVIIVVYGPYAASNTWSQGFKPIARYVLDHYPALYNPLGSTFYCGINNALGGYDYTTPLIYTDTNGCVRKILATEKDAEQLSQTYICVNHENKWFTEKLKKLSSAESYISIPVKYNIVKYNTYTPGLDICFTQDGYNAGTYINSGIYEPEEWGTWSGNQIIMYMKFEHLKENSIPIHITCGVYNHSQRVQIYVNDCVVFDKVVIENEGIDFLIENPESICKILILLPDASQTAPSDGRILGLSLGHIVFN